MTKIIQFKQDSEPFLVSEFRTEFHIMNAFSLLIYLGVMVLGFYLFFTTRQDSVISFEFGLGLLGLFQVIRSIIGLLRNSLVVWKFYENEVFVKSIYINREIRFIGSQIIDYESKQLRSHFRAGQSDGYKLFMFDVKFENEENLQTFSIDQFTFSNFYEMRQALLDMADYKRED